jgi:ABC-type sugar transport system substrate-binding protein
MKYTMITLAANMRKLCFAIPLFALFLMAAVTAHAETKRVGVAMSLFDDMWLTTLRHGVQSYAEKLGVKVTFEDAGGDIGKQQSQIQNFIASKVDGILVATLVDPSARSRHLQSGAGSRHSTGLRQQRSREC